MFDSFKNKKFAHDIGTAMVKGDIEALYKALHPLERARVDEGQFHMLMRPVLDSIRAITWHKVEIEVPGKNSANLVWSAQTTASEGREMLYVSMNVVDGVRYVPLRSLLDPVKNWSGVEPSAVGLVLAEMARERAIIEKLKRVGVTELMGAPGEFKNPEVDLAESIAEFGETREEVEAWFAKQEEVAEEFGEPEWEGEVR